MPFLEVNGASVFYAVEGGGAPAVVFVHGALCSHEDWRGQFADLGAEHTVVALDNRGHGRSAVENFSTCTVDQMASDVELLMEHLAHPAVLLVGHSLGCRVVLEVAARKPTSVKGVVLVDGSLTDSDPSGLRSMSCDDLRRFVQQDSEQPAFLGHCQPEERHRILASQDQAPTLLMRAMLESVTEWDRRRAAEVIAGLPMPLVSVQATTRSNSGLRRSLTSDETSTAWLDFVRRHHPGLEAVMLHDVGHFAMLEAAPDVNDAIRDLSRRLGYR